MKKAINGTNYNTETARLVGKKKTVKKSIDPASESYIVTEALYVKKTGKYFLRRVDNLKKSKDTIEPLTYDEALQWAACNMKPEDYNKEFSVDQNNDKRVTLCLSMNENVAKKLRRDASINSKRISVVAEEIIKAHYDKNDSQGRILNDP